MFHTFNFKGNCDTLRTNNTLRGLTISKFCKEIRNAFPEAMQWKVCWLQKLQGNFKMFHKFSLLFIICNIFICENYILQNYDMKHIVHYSFWNVYICNVSLKSHLCLAFQSRQCFLEHLIQNHEGILFKDTYVSYNFIHQKMTSLYAYLFLTTVIT